MVAHQFPEIKWDGYRIGRQRFLIYIQFAAGQVSPDARVMNIGV
jgi:hypothetical protein